MIWVFVGAILLVAVSPVIGLLIGELGLRLEPKQPPLTRSPSWQEQQIRLACDRYVEADNMSIEELERALDYLLGMTERPPANLTQMQRAHYAFNQRILKERLAQHGILESGAAIDFERMGQ